MPSVRQKAVLSKRDLWPSTLMDRPSYSEWREKPDGARDRAREKEKRILDTHQPDMMPEKMMEELHKTTHSAESLED